MIIAQNIPRWLPHTTESPLSIMSNMNKYNGDYQDLVLTDKEDILELKLLTLNPIRIFQIKLTYIANMHFFYLITLIKPFSLILMHYFILSVIGLMPNIHRPCFNTTTVHRDAHVVIYLA